MPARWTLRIGDLVSGAVGRSGENEDYVLSTLKHLKALDIRDRWLEEVASKVAPNATS